MKRGLIAAAHDARQRRRQRARARPLRIGHVEHDQIGGAAQQLGRRGKTADEGGVFGAVEQIAGGIVGRMDEEIGGADPMRERAGHRAAVARRAAIAVRRSGEIGGADCFDANIAT